MDIHALTEFIKFEAIKLGFDACGIAKADNVSAEYARDYETWLSNGFNADMSYMNRNQEKRLDPRKLVEETKSIIVVALNYYHDLNQEKSVTDDRLKIARYALNPDYHKIIRDKLYLLLESVRSQGIAVKGRAFADSAPVAERYWAKKAGIGWTGKNHNIIIPGKGSYFLLGELMVDIDLEYDHPVKDYCGNCTKCIEACPGSALKSGEDLDARKCISWMSIEKKEDLTSEEAHLCGKNGYFFGCDICQDICPWNRFSKEQMLEEMQAIDQISGFDADKFLTYNEEDFAKIFANTNLYRSGLRKLTNNLNIIMLKRK
jgi:epoxyqueuosine reductase